MRARIPFGKYLHERRVMLRLSLRAFALSAKLTPSKLFRIEREETEPTLSELESLSAVFGENVPTFLLVRNQFSKWKLLRNRELAEFTSNFSAQAAEQRGGVRV